VTKTHIAWNLAGLAIPLIVAATTVPALLKVLGSERFGLLALAWGLIGYAGVLDLGLGRALTQVVSSLRGERRVAEIADYLVTASRITLLAGLLGCSLIVLFAILGGASLIHTQATPQSEIRISIFLLAIALPAQSMSSTYKGLNEAFLNFKGINLLRSVLGVINFAGPYAVSFFSVRLSWLILPLVITRLLSLGIYKKLALNCLHREPGAQQDGRYSSSKARKLFRFGGWATVSSIISPIMVNSDRFFIASQISAVAVSIYFLPFEIVVQTLIVVSAITTVLFPTLSKKLQEDPEGWKLYFFQWLVRVSTFMAFSSIVLAVFMPIILNTWIGSSFDEQSVVIGRILCLGVFANSIASMYYSLFHARGRSDLTAQIHLVELPIYLFLLFLMLKNFGLVGASIAWSLRMIFDLIILHFTSELLNNDRLIRSAQ